MNKELAKEFLFEIDDVFNKYNIVYSLDCGTLLGAIRDKDFIDWDDDLDFSIYTPIHLNYSLWENIIRDFSTKNIHILTTWGDSVISLKKIKPGELITTDIHTYKKVNKEYQCAMSNNLFSFPEEFFNSLDLMDFRGRKFHIPHNTEDYLSLLYGENWKEPHPEVKIWTSKNCTPYYHEKINSYIRNEPIFNPRFDKQNKVSILIPTFNKTKLLEYTLNAYVQQDKPFNYEIIILNDYLGDDTSAVVSSFLGKLEISYWFTGQRNKPGDIKWRIPGFPFNIGAKLATGTILLLTCPEIYPMTKDCLLKTIEPLFTQTRLITHPIFVKDDRCENNLNSDNYGTFLKDLEDNNGVFTKTESDYNKLEPLKAYYPFFLAMHKKEYINIGGYDEDFIGNCYDDTDIYNRLKLNGCTFLPISESKVLHLYHKRLNYKSEQIMQEQEYNKKLYYEREKVVVRNIDKDWGKL